MSDILSLPIEGEDISKKLAGKPDPNLFSAYKNIHGLIMVVELELALRNLTTPDDDFLRKFVLYAIITVVAPTAQHYVDEKYLNLVQDIGNIKNLNWGCFTLDHLSSSLDRFNNLDQVCLQGNLPLLQVSASSLVKILHLLLCCISLYTDEEMYCIVLVL